MVSTDRTNMSGLQWELTNRLLPTDEPYHPGRFQPPQVLPVETFVESNDTEPLMAQEILDKRSSRCDCKLNQPVRFSHFFTIFTSGWRTMMECIFAKVLIRLDKWVKMTYRQTDMFSPVSSKKAKPNAVCVPIPESSIHRCSQDSFS